MSKENVLTISCDDCKMWEELDSDQPRTQAHAFTFNYDTEKWKCNACKKELKEE
tara:strand:- start:1601 stop:1762 length:162 start_codon:yes stop_codon:yes gene_type:complete